MCHDYYLREREWFALPEEEGETDTEEPERAFDDPREDDREEPVREPPVPTADD